MTSSTLPDVRTFLADAGVRRSLTNLVRARVPARDADDVVQAVLCAALAAEVAPAESANLPRWIAGIARHKVADAYRRARRDAPVEGPEAVAPADAFEARELTARVACEAASDPASREALGWIAREHAGESWDEIARAEQLPSTVVRKRVSRFRRSLRSRWLGGLTLAVAVGLPAWAIAAFHARITADAGGIVAEDLAPGASALRGDWAITRIDVDADGDASADVRALVKLEGVVSRVHVSGGQVTFRSPTRTRRFAIVAASRDAAADVVTLRDDAGRDHRVTVTHAAGAPGLRVRIDDGPWRGTLTLARVAARD